MPLVLRCLGTIVIAIAALRIAVGASADRLLDPTIARDAVRHPSVDSQVRFYGTMFGLTGVVLWIGASDTDRYGPVLTAAFVVFLIAGLARVPAAARHGLPARPVLALTAVELVAPPLLLWWQLA